MPNTPCLPDHVQHYVEARNAQVEALDAGDVALADAFDPLIARIFAFFTVSDFALVELDARGELARAEAVASFEEISRALGLDG